MKEETDFFLMEAKISLEETWGKSFIKFSMPHVNPSCFVYVLKLSYNMTVPIIKDK